MDTRKKLFSTKYRIVYDNYGGYGVQFKKWWYPLWIDSTGTFTSIDRAREYVKGHKHKVIEYVYE